MYVSGENKMTYFKFCSKCNIQFLTGDRQDNICSNCDGTFPRLKYFEIDKDER